MSLYNGKYGGGGIMLNPFGMINDGFLELNFRTGYLSASTSIYMFLQPGGRMCYDRGFNIYRCKQAKVTNKLRDNSGQPINQHINIDGEDFYFDNYFKFECKH